MNAQDFVALISTLNKNTAQLSLGKIDPAYATGRPKIVFDGDTSASGKAYPYLSSYTPSANDRVLIANVGGSHVVLGKIL